MVGLGSPAFLPGGIRYQKVCDAVFTRSVPRALLLQPCGQRESGCMIMGCVHGVWMRP